MEGSEILSLLDCTPNLSITDVSEDLFAAITVNEIDVIINATANIQVNLVSALAAALPLMTPSPPPDPIPNPPPSDLWISTKPTKTKPTEDGQLKQYFPLILNLKVFWK
jgi:hypothetical protein